MNEHQKEAIKHIIDRVGQGISMSEALEAIELILKYANHDPKPL